MIHLKYINFKTLGNSEETNSLSSMSNEWNTIWYIHMLHIPLSSGGEH